MTLSEAILSAGSRGDWAELNRAGRALNAAYELARVHDIDADRDEAMRVSVSPIWRDERITGDCDSDSPDYAKEQ